MRMEMWTGMRCHEMLWEGIPNFFANGAYNVLHVDNLHRILDIKGPLLMW
ncbi:hypothetical protein BT93_J1148 [Corymbia citriodora subsp. variegata]|nr:hypothetical protein BT93_J1148 [Corymbia citriodora subsp. variegata]